LSDRQGKVRISAGMMSPSQADALFTLG